MTNLTELDVLREVCARLQRAGIDYMLTGSMAMMYYARPRMTRDIDLVVALNRADARQLVETFEPAFFLDSDAAMDAITNESMFNLLHQESLVKVDMLVRKNTPFRRAEFQRRRRVAIDDFELWIVSREDLILSKLVWAKPSGSELQLRDVRNLLNEPPDMTYLRYWAEELQVVELLGQCIA